MRLRVTRVTYSPIALPLERPIATAHETIAIRRGFVVRVEDETGEVGYGDAMPMPAFGTESLETCAAALEQGARRLLGARGLEASALSLEQSGGRGGPMLELLPAFPCARAGLDVALHDLAARREGQSVANWIVGAPVDAAPPIAVPVHALIVDDARDGVAASALEAKSKGYRSFKLKVGALPLSDDIRRVAALRAAIAPDDRIRLDANGAWGESAALRALAALADYDIDFVEQPVAAADLTAMARLRNAAPIPIAADESLLAGRGEACLAARAADRLILKPAALGGLGPAWRLSQSGRRANVPSIVTSFFDSALGVAAALHLAVSIHLAKALPPAASVHSAMGIATRGILQTDLADLPPAVEGMVRWPTGPGLGIEPDPARVDQLLTGRVWEGAL